MVLGVLTFMNFDYIYWEEGDGINLLGFPMLIGGLFVVMMGLTQAEVK